MHAGTRASRPTSCGAPPCDPREGISCHRRDDDLAERPHDSNKQAVEEILRRTDGELYAVFNNGAFGLPGAVEDLSRDRTTLRRPMLPRPKRSKLRQEVAEAKAEFGSLSYLVNVAGISHHAPIHEITDEQWSRMIAVHLNGSFYCIRAILPGMLEAGFGIISQKLEIVRRGQTHCPHPA